MRRGRILEAHRVLERAEADGCVPTEPLDCRHVEQVRRVAARFRESQALAEDARAKGSGWSSDQVSDTLQVQSRFAGGVLEMHVSTSFPGSSALLAVVGLCEGDLCKGYKPNVQRTQCLHEDSLESTWLVLQRRSMNGALEDSVAEVSAVDALDEEDGCIWVGISSAQADAARVRGVAVPPPAKGVRRVGDSDSVFRISPVGGRRAGSKTGPSGFEMSMHVSLRPSGSQLKLLSSMPSFALRVLVRKKAQEFETHFRRHVGTCAEIERRVLASPRSEFYMHVRQRVEQLGAEASPRDLLDDRLSTCSTSAPPASEDASDDPSACLGRLLHSLTPGPCSRSQRKTSTCTSTRTTLRSGESFCDPASPSSCDRRARLAGLSLASADWVDLSTQIPMSWAD